VGAIAAEARVTTGAIYHHFGSKKGLFQAVAEAIETEILTKAETGAGEISWQFLQTAFARLIDLCAAPDIQRIIFVEGSHVLGPEAWRELERRYAIGAVTFVLTQLMAQGVVRQAPIELVARLMVAILREASAEVARTGGDPAARAEVARLTEGFLQTLLADRAF
jgi:AcrR family transcriptional regulator